MNSRRTIIDCAPAVKYSPTAGAPVITPAVRSEQVNGFFATDLQACRRAVSFRQQFSARHDRVQGGARAIQAMPNGGEVVLRAVVDDHKVRLEVQDQGIGIAEENLERIFNPFFTTRQAGTGLGLSIAERIVTQHGGQIELRRNPASGMIFSVILPATESAHPRAVETRT